MLEKEIACLIHFHLPYLTISNTILISCGTAGLDISKNKGKSWDLISNESFHVVRKQPNTKAVFLAGAGGRIGYYSIP